MGVRRRFEMGATAVSDCRNSKLKYHIGIADAWMDAQRLVDIRPARRSGRPRPPKQNPRSTGLTPSGMPRVDFKR